MGYRLGIDLGTTFTAAAIDEGGGATLLALGSRAPIAPSVVFLSPDGTFSFGEVAGERSAAEPARAARDIKGRIGETAPVLLGGQPFSPQELYAKLLSWTVATATQLHGAEPDEVVVTCPFTWGDHEHQLLKQAFSLVALPPAVTCTDAQAAATHHASRSPLSPGDKVAVYDLGGQTFEVCVLERNEDGFTVLGSPDGERFGGVDVDEAVFQHVLAQLADHVSGVDRSDPQFADLLMRLRRRCVDAKEALSSDTEATIPVSLPDLTTSVRLTRAELDGLVVSALRDTIEALRRVLQSANLTPAELRTVVLVGGSARIPVVRDLVQSELGVQTAMSDDPQLDVALGAVSYHPSGGGTGTGGVAVSAAPTVASWPTRGLVSADHARATPEPTGDGEPVAATEPRSDERAPAALEPTLIEAARTPLLPGLDDDTAALTATADFDIPQPEPPPPRPQPSAREREVISPISTVYAAGLPPPVGPSPPWSSEPTGPGRISRPVGLGLAALGAIVAVVVVGGALYVFANRGGSTPVVGHDVILVPIVRSGTDPVLHQLSTAADQFGHDLGTVPGIPAGAQTLPSVTPDGHLLEYRLAPPGSGFANQGGTLMEVSHDGHSVPLFTQSPQGLLCHGRAAWSPDGKHVALACYDDLNGDGKDDNAHPGVYVFPVDGDGRVNGVPQGLWAKSSDSIIGSVSYTPSGDIAAAYVGGQAAGLHVGTPGETPTRLTSGADLDPVSSPSGNLIAFSRDGDLYLTATDATTSLPCAAPRVSSTDVITHARLCDLTGTTTGPAAPASAPTWSWDGQTIAYRIDNPATNTSTLWLIRLTPGVPVPLSTQPLVIGAPGWGPR